jgi:hypothetical protein
MPIEKEPVISGHPLNVLLDAERRGDRTAEDVVFLTYNFDPAYFEASLLPLCQSTGGATTIIADANIWNPDPRALVAAGRSYHLSLASVPGAFHPKVMLISGPERVDIVIGSGNLTQGGWQYNEEIFTSISIADQTCPLITIEIAKWIDLLRTTLITDPLAQAALQRTTQCINRLIGTFDTIDTTHTFHHNMITPIADQLPKKHVETLRMFAPFHDPNCAALRNLVSRFSPRSVELAVQPGLTVINAEALSKIMNSHKNLWHLTAPAEHSSAHVPYRHGKLIEWQKGTETRTLTGSPNLSIAALFRTVNQGNCEAAISSPATASLFPAGGEIPVTAVPTVEITSAHTKTAGDIRLPVILSAVMTTECTILHLSRPSSPGASIEVSPRMDSPDLWNSAGELKAGASEHRIKISAEAGSRIRIAFKVSNGSTFHGASFPLSDPALVLLRWDSAASQIGARVDRTNLLGSDPTMLTYLHKELLELARQMSFTRPPRIQRDIPEAGIANKKRVSDTDIDPWKWNDSAAERMSGQLRSFALGLPVIVESREVATPQWVDRTDLTQVEAADDEDITDEITEEIEQLQNEQSDVRSHRSDPDTIRRRRRQWCRKIAPVLPRMPLPAQLAALRVVLYLYCLGNWDYDDDDDALTAIHNILSVIDIDEGSDAQKSSAASLAAVALSVMRDRITFTSHTERTGSYKALAESYDPYLSMASGAKINAYCEHLTNQHGSPLEPDFVRQTMQGIIRNDELANIVQGLQQIGWGVERIGDHVIRLTGSFTQPAGVVIRALSMVDDDVQVVIVAETLAGTHAVAAWKRPDLFVVVPGKYGQRWRHWVLNGLTGAAAFARQMVDDPSALPRPVMYGPQVERIPAGENLLQELGLELAE